MSETTKNVPAEVRIPFLNDFTRKCKITHGPRNPECGNGRHSYVIQSGNGDGSLYEANIHFQEGALTEGVGFNGVFSIALLAVIVDHLKSFQDGPFATREGAIAITKLEEATHWLCARADERAARGVLGKHTK